MPTDGAAAPEMGGMIPPSAPGQGPTATGRVVFSNDFEMNNITGFSRSPNGLPEDRAKIIDDPAGQRGKVVQIEWRAGDNFRTSGGTEPRSWFSNRPGHEFRPGTNVSHAFGIMFNQADTNYCFGQIISSGGPVWMLILEGVGHPDRVLQHLRRQHPPHDAGTEEVVRLPGRHGLPRRRRR